MSITKVEVGSCYKYNGRDMQIIRKSPAPPGGYMVAWKTIDDEPLITGETGEPIFCASAIPLDKPTPE